MSLTRPLALAALLAPAVLLTLAATMAHAQVSGGVVRIGVLNDQSGPYADLGGQGAVVAARMAIEDFGGTVLGKPIEVVFADHQNKPDIGSAIATRWFDVDGVDVLVDVPNSAVALAIQEVARQKDRLVLNSGAATSDLTGKACSPNGIHWVYDTYALAAGTGRTMVKEGGDTWFFLTVDYAFGHALERDVTAVVKASGGKVLGGVRHPLNTADFSSFLLQAQASGAKVVGLANAGADTRNSIKQAGEFGIVQGGQHLAGLLVFINDIHALGLKAAAGLYLTEGFYWDLSDETRAWSKRFFAQMKRMPNMTNAGVYSSVLHYLKGIKAAGTDSAKPVVAKMRGIPVDDVLAKHGQIREDGRMVYDLYLFQVKKPEESKYPWDYYRLVRVIPGKEAFRPLAESECKMVKR